MSSTTSKSPLDDTLLPTQSDSLLSQGQTLLNELELDERNLAFVIYGLLFISPFSLGLTALVAVVLAYIKKHNCDSFVQTHFRYQIKSFWVVFVLWALATFIAVICTVFLTLTLANVILAQYNITDWRYLDIDLSNLDTSQIPVSTILGVASGFVISALMTVLATVWILVSAVMGFIRLSHNKPIGKRFAKA